MVFKNSAQARRAFTLTELAIVLGVIGVVGGGLWLAIGASNSSMRVKKGVEAVLFITQRMRAIHANRSQVDNEASIALPASMLPQVITNKKQLTYIDQGVFPSDMVIDNNRLINPGGGAVGLSAAGQNQMFFLAFSRVPLKDCVDMTLTLGGEGRDPKLSFLVVTQGATSPAGSTALALPTDLAIVTGTVGCKDAMNNIGFYYGL